MSTRVSVTENGRKGDGVYVMQVASMLTGMHPQTLRKYERAGFLTPSRSRTFRRYSDEDIERLNLIKHMVDNCGLNLAGVELALKMRARVLDMRREVVLNRAGEKLEKRLGEIIDELLGILGHVKHDVGKEVTSHVETERVRPV